MEAISTIAIVKVFFIVTFFKGDLIIHLSIWKNASVKSTNNKTRIHSSEGPQCQYRHIRYFKLTIIRHKCRWLEYNPN